MPLTVEVKDGEVVSMIDLVRDLSDGLTVLNPYSDVPNPFESSSLESTSAAPWFLPHQEQREKDPMVWQKELVTTVWNTGLPQLLRCCSTTIMAVVSSLGDRAVLMDRETHAPNSFGKVRTTLVPDFEFEILTFST